MRVSDATLAEVRERGFSLVEGFLADEELAAAQEALWLHFPRPEDYFADPVRFARYAASQFAGVEEFPYRSWDLNRLAVHPDLVDMAERYLETTELHLYKVELWAKYAGAVNYDQPLHRDYGSHSLVVPRPEARYQQLTTFIYLSDVTEEDGPTRIVPYEDGKDVPYTPLYMPFGSLADAEVACTGPAGSLLVYRTDILHRGSEIDRRRPVTLLHPRRLPGPRHDLGRQDGLAQAVARALGQVHAAVQRARARPLRLPPARRPLLVRGDARGRGGPLPRHRPRALRAGVVRPSTGGHDDSPHGVRRSYWHHSTEPRWRNDMPAQVILEFEGVTTKEYDAVNAALGLDPATGERRLARRSAGPRGRAQRGRPPGGDRDLGHPRAPGQVHGGAPRRGTRQGRHHGPPSSVTWIELVAHHTPGGLSRRATVRRATARERRWHHSRRIPFPTSKGRRP